MSDSHPDVDEILQYLDQILFTLSKHRDLMLENTYLLSIVSLFKDYINFIDFKNLEELKNGFFVCLEANTVEILQPNPIKVYDIERTKWISAYVVIRAALKMCCCEEDATFETVRSVYLDEFAKASKEAYNYLLNKVDEWFNNILDRIRYGIKVSPSDIKIVDDIYDIVRINKFIDERKLRIVKRTRMQF